MARKVASTIYKTKLLTDKHGDVGFYYLPSEKPRPLPDDLARPFSFVLLDHFKKESATQKLQGQAKEVALLKLDATAEAALVENFSERWRRLHKHFKSDGSPEGWKKLAIALASEYVPGLKIEFVRPSAKDLAKDTRDGNIVMVVAERLVDLRKKRTNVREWDAIQSVYKNWPINLGKQPKDKRAFSTAYYRAKSRFEDLSGYSPISLGLPTTKRSRTKK